MFHYQPEMSLINLLKEIPKVLRVTQDEASGLERNASRNESMETHGTSVLSKKRNRVSITGKMTNTREADVHSPHWRSTWYPDDLRSESASLFLTRAIE